MTHADAERAIKHRCKEAAAVLEVKSLAAFNNMARDEVAKYSTNSVGNLDADILARAVVLAVANEALDAAFNAENLKGNIPKVRRIAKRQ